MAYQYHRKHDLEATQRLRGAFNPYRALLCKLLGRQTDRPRLKTAVNVWRKPRRDRIKFEAQKIADSTRRKGKKREAMISIRDRVARSMFGKLPETERHFWKQEAASEHDIAMKAWLEEIDSPVPSDPAARQRYVLVERSCKVLGQYSYDVLSRCIQGLVQFIQPIIDHVSEATGWPISVITGGPEPAQGGQLQILTFVSHFYAHFRTTNRIF